MNYLPISSSPLILQKCLDSFDPKTACDFVVERSLRAQRADSQFLFSVKTIGEQVLTGLFPRPILAPPQTPFMGTCERLIRIINNTVHEALRCLDFNGLRPHLQVLRQIEEGKSFREIIIKSRSEEQGGVCVSIAHTVLKHLQQKHGIEGSLAVGAGGRFHTFSHAVAIVECVDGYVFIESTKGPVPVAIPFEQTRDFGDGYYVTASKPKSSIPLRVVHKQAGGTSRSVFEFCTGISNAEELSLKYYVISTLWRFGSIPIGFPGNIQIAFFDSERVRRKYIVVCPSESKILFKDVPFCGASRTKEMGFSSILQGDLLPSLRSFMQPLYCCTIPGFRTAYTELHSQIVEYVSKVERMRGLFIQTDLDEVV
jgi:hypothetical protein